MPPTSSPVPRLSSVPSDASTVHAIASRSPGRTTNKGEGRAGTLHRLCVDAIATTSPPHRHRSTSNQTGSAAGCLSSCPPRLSSVPSAVLTVRTIASRSSGRTTNKGEGRAGTLPGSGWMPSPPPRHRSTSNQKGSASFCLSSCPPRPLPRPLFQVVRVGQTTIHGGPPLPAHPADPIHHAGVPRHIGGHLRRGGGQRGAISGRRGSSSRKFVSGFFLRLYRSKYQLFIFSEGLSRAKPVPRGNDNDT